MCGIAGQLKLDDGPVDRRLVTRMTARLAHRGPDADGFYFDRRVGLGHRRLSIIDVKGGAQPMVDRERRLTLVANNEIYNYQELRRDASRAGHRFTTDSDTETILHVFAQYGPAGIRRLEGMFAFAIWDAAAETLTLARDPFGIKPLYYYQDARCLLFASEMTALFEYPSLDTEFDAAAVDGYLASLAVPEPHSILARVRKLPAGHYLTMRRGATTLTRYWDAARIATSPSAARSTRTADLDAGLVTELDRSVSITLRSDVPVGILLSGGLDSSAVAAVAARVTGEPHPTFSAGFVESGFDERRFARLVAQSCGSRHREVVVTKAQATRIARALTRVLDEPFADASAIPTYGVCELASAHVKAVLSGEGGDELFGGYPWHGRIAPSSSARAAGRAHPARAVFQPDERRELVRAGMAGQLAAQSEPGTWNENEERGTRNGPSAVTA